jgi:outer membrane lipoprotein carrier protein
VRRLCSLTCTALFAQLLLGIAAGAAAPGATALDRYLEGLKSLRTSFSQSVTDARGQKSDPTRGELLVLRPGRFRWDIHPQRGGESGQLLVADGRNLWFFDRDLAQVTVKPMDAALSDTPAMLLSGAADVRSAFEVESDGRHEDLDWVRITPRSAEADFREARLGFAGDDLKRMVLKDKLGQTATLTFERTQRNAPVAVDEVSFTPPPGTDVIGTPQK